MEGRGSQQGMEEVLREGKYRLLRQIGGGGGGVVWSARHRPQNEKVAVKKISSLFKDIDTVKRTLREIRLLRHFRHENIISIRDVLLPSSKENFNEIFLICDLMASNLHKVIKSPQPLPDKTVKCFVYQILRGLKCIHSAGVLHRDLKPTNLLVSDRCDVKICDFGCGRSASTTGGRMGLKMTLLEHVATRWYRAPEGLLSSENYTSAVDIWSVGCILAELLQRNVLFPGKTNSEQITKIIEVLGSPPLEEIESIQSQEFRSKILSMPHTPPKNFQEIFPQASPLALDLLQQMLRFDPAKRITVTEALAHPYLAYWHREDDEPVAESLFSEVVDADLAIEDYRDLIYDEIANIRCQLALMEPPLSVSPSTSNSSAPSLSPSAPPSASSVSRSTPISTSSDMDTSNNHPHDVRYPANPTSSVVATAHTSQSEISRSGNAREMELEQEQEREREREMEMERVREIERSLGATEGLFLRAGSKEP